MLWYPTVQPERTHAEGSLVLATARDAAPAAGKHPLIVLSHGSKGTPMMHWKTGQFFARKGYMVLAMVHPSDDLPTMDEPAGLEVWKSRPEEWSAALDSLLQSRYADSVDKNRIAAVGFSAGAYTALVIGGAQASSLALDSYCLKRPQKNVMCARHHPIERLAMRILPQIGLKKETTIAHKDARAKVVVAMAPVGAALFTPLGLERLNVPTFLLMAENDIVLNYPNNAQYIKNILGDRLELAVIPGGHFVFTSMPSLASFAYSPEHESVRTDKKSEALLDSVHHLIYEFLERSLASHSP